MVSLGRIFALSSNERLRLLRMTTRNTGTLCAAIAASRLVLMATVLDLMRLRELHYLRTTIVSPPLPIKQKRGTIPL